MGKGSLIVFFIVLSLPVFAQPFSSANGLFTVDAKTGCAGFSTPVHLPNCGGGPPSGVFCIIDYGDGRTPVPFTDGDPAPYPTAGSFTMTIVYSTSAVDNIQMNVVASNPPTFDAYLCAGQVSVKVTERNYPFYQINYNDATAEVTVPANAATDIHGYGPGIHNISVQGYNGAGSVDNCAVNTQIINVQPLAPTTINQVEVLNTTSVKVDFATSPYTQYRMTIGTNMATSFQQYKTILPPVNSETVSGIRPDDNYYCFQMQTFNPCTNAPAAYSNIVCSINSDAPVAQNNQNQITWVTAAASGTHLLSAFDVLRDGAVLAPAWPASPYIDAAVVCNTPYQYQIIGNYPAGVRSLSLARSVTAVSNDPPTPIQNISAIVTDPGVDLIWIPDATFTATEYQVRKSIQGNNNPLPNTTEPTLTDPDYLTADNSCYQISYIDQCNNTSAFSAEACPIRLSGTLQADNVITINWSPYDGWVGGVSNYMVEKYNEQGQLISSTDVGNVTTYTDAAQDIVNQVYRYVVVANPNDATVSLSSSNVIEIIKEPNLFYPTAFTPNSDGLNDNFNVFGQYVAKFQMKIFNRWGEMMYSTDDLGGKGWDGTFRGNLMPEGTYVFTAQITDLADRTFDRSGSVLLLRKK